MPGMSRKVARCSLAAHSLLTRDPVRLVPLRLLMADLDRRSRVNTANAKAASLGDGYRVQAELQPAAHIYTVRAYRLPDHTTAGRFLCNTHAADGIGRARGQPGRSSAAL